MATSGRNHDGRMNSPARDEIVAGEARDHEVGTDSVADECPEIGVAQSLVDGIAPPAVERGDEDQGGRHHHQPLMRSRVAAKPDGRRRHGHERKHGGQRKDEEAQVSRELRAVEPLALRFRTDTGDDQNWYQNRPHGADLPVPRRLPRTNEEHLRCQPAEPRSECEDMDLQDQRRRIVRFAAPAPAHRGIEADEHGPPTLPA